MNLPPPGGAQEATIRDFVSGQKLFNRYTLKRILGRGGMGVVWLARDEVLDRDAALKFLPEVIFYDRGMLSDLKRETNRSLELTHKNIVRIYDFVHDERSGCISMEFVDGDTLSNIRADRPLRVFECWELGDWIKQLCEALDYAHNYARVVHRDLKPSNLMMNLRGDLKVTDFGIARTLGDSVSMLTVGQKHTSGTLVYMSPQQLDGARGSHLDDIYSLGATLYELLTSKPPFFSGNIDRQIHERKPPSMNFRREELDIVGGEPIDQVWEDVIAACLQKDPAERPQSALDVVARLTGPVRQPSSILGGWFQLAKPVAKTEHKTAARTATSPSTKTRPPTAQPATGTTRPKRESRHLVRRAWLAVCAAFVSIGGGIRNAGIAASGAISAAFIGTGRGVASFGRLVANDIAALLTAIAGGLVALGRGAVFIVVAPAKLLSRGTATATPVLLRVSRNAGAVLVKGSGVAVRSMASSGRVLGRETLLGTAVTVIPATITAALIWFFAIRIPPPRPTAQEKPAPPVKQNVPPQPNVALIAPVVPKPSAPPLPPPVGGLSINTAPPGAKVIVDGSIVKMSPVSVSDLPPGKHHLQIVLPDYVTEERDVDVKAGETTSEGTIALQPIAPPAAPAAVVTADGLTKPPAKAPEQEQAPVVKKVTRHKVATVTQKQAAPTAERPPTRPVAAAPPPAPSKPTPKPANSPQKPQRAFEGGVPGG